jgi:hypothetical protein
VNAHEQAVLGHCLWQPADALRLLTVAEPGMFYGSGHSSVASLLLAMLEQGIPVDPTTVAGRLQSGPAAHLYAPNAGTWCHTLMQASPRLLDGALWHAGMVRSTWLARQAQIRTQRVADTLADPDDPDLARDYAMRELATAQEELGAAAAGAAQDVPHLGHLLAEKPPPIRWRVPNLISERDKIIWTGLEGLAKTELGLLLAVSAAAGMQPWTGEMHEPQRVMIYDLENERDALLRRLWRIVRAAERVAPDGHGGGMDRSLIALRTAEAGIDITRPDDFSRLRRDVDGHRPGILLIGPLSKIAKGHSLNDEEVAVMLCGQLDRLRVEHNLATLTEAHSGKEKGSDGQRLPAPRGSSYFIGWPASGFGLRPHADNGDADPVRIAELKTFRGNREERWWPDKLIRQNGTEELPVLPFAPGWDADPPHLRLVR